MSRSTRNENRCVPISHPMMQKGIRRLGNQQFMNKGAGSSGNPKRRTMKGSDWETFNLAGRNQLTWEKWQRERQPKADSKKVRFRSLEGRRTKSQFSEDTPERKVSKRLLGKKHQKKKIMRNEEETSHQYCWHNIGSGTQGSKWGELVVSREP